MFGRHLRGGAWSHRRRSLRQCVMCHQEVAFVEEDANVAKWKVAHAKIQLYERMTVHLRQCHAGGVVKRRGAVLVRSRDRAVRAACARTFLVCFACCGAPGRCFRGILM